MSRLVDSFKEQTTTNFTSLVSIFSAKVYNFLSLLSFLIYLASLLKAVNSSLLYKIEAKLFIMAFSVIYNLASNHLPNVMALNNNNGDNNNNNSNVDIYLQCAVNLFKPITYII